MRSSVGACKSLLGLGAALLNLGTVLAASWIMLFVDDPLSLLLLAPLLTLARLEQSMFMGSTLISAVERQYSPVDLVDWLFVLLYVGEQVFAQWYCRGVSDMWNDSIIQLTEQNSVP